MNILNFKSISKKDDNYLKRNRIILILLLFVIFFAFIIELDQGLTREVIVYYFISPFLILSLLFVFSESRNFDKVMPIIFSIILAVVIVYAIHEFSTNRDIINIIILFFYIGLMTIYYNTRLLLFSSFLGFIILIYILVYFNKIAYNETEILMIINLYITTCLLMLVISKLGLEMVNEVKTARLEINHDQLTGIPNRSNFKKVISNIINIKNEEERFALALLNIDGFRYINDIYGHDFGDLVLIKISRIIEKSLRGSDYLARLSGDEFVLIIQNKKNIDEVGIVLNNIKSEIEKPLIIKGMKHSINISMGVSIYPSHGKTMTELLTSADKALHYIKKQGKSNIIFYNSKLKDSNSLEK